LHGFESRDFEARLFYFIGLDKHFGSAKIDKDMNNIINNKKLKGSG
jgi:hypothetical protein